MTGPTQLPLDADVDLHISQHDAELRQRPWSVLSAIAVGGALGSLARHATEQAFGAAPGGFPWATFGINVAGCLLIGVLMVLVGEFRAGHRVLLRPLLGVGVLGGFTTFSFHVLQAHELLKTGAVGTATAYVAGTAIAAVLAVGAGMIATRRVLRARARWAAA